MICFVVLVKYISLLPVVPSLSRIPVYEPLHLKPRRSPFPKSFTYLVTSSRSCFLFSKSFHCHTSENSPVSLAIATDPKMPSRKSFSCHTSETPRGLHSDTVGRAVSRALSSLAATLMDLLANVANKRLTNFPKSFRCNTYTKPGEGASPPLNGGEEAAVRGDIAVGHARCIEREVGIAAAVEEDEATSGRGYVWRRGGRLRGRPQRGARGPARNAYALQFRQEDTM